jgi:hypothetical protein
MIPEQPTACGPPQRHAPLDHAMLDNYLARTAREQSEQNQSTKHCLMRLYHAFGLKPSKRQRNSNSTKPPQTHDIQGISPAGLNATISNTTLMHLAFQISPFTYIQTQN